MRNRKSNLLLLEHRLSQLERRIKNESMNELYALAIT